MTSVIFANNHWYLFCRLHQILCHRLYQIYEQAVRIAEEEAKCKRERKESTAIALRLKSPSKNPEYFYIFIMYCNSTLFITRVFVIFQSFSGIMNCCYRYTKIVSTLSLVFSF